MANTFLKEQWYVKTVGKKLCGGSMDYVKIDSIEELEELYTKHVITYYQYLNAKEELKNKEKKEEDN